ncbi:MAG: hypothetical protein J2P28_04290 [Actinobacteria bacterium]|nr:hypothetical protein [Actinomycetota bacterium]MBO0834727.1 hypothetical protein [Actinomycetota bacterium]
MSSRFCAAVGSYLTSTRHERTLVESGTGPAARDLEALNRQFGTVEALRNAAS